MTAVDSPATLPGAVTDPSRLYQALAADRPHTALLESGDGPERSPGNSLIVERAALRIGIRGRTTRVEALTDLGASLCAALAEESSLRSWATERSAESVTFTHPRPDPLLEDLARIQEPGPLDVLRGILRVVDTPAPHRLLVGVLHFELVAAFEQIPGMDEADARADFLLAERFLRVDHADGQTQVVELGDRDPALTARVLQFARRDQPEGDPNSAASGAASDPGLDLDDRAFAGVVERCREHVLAGDVFQVVPSRSFRVPCTDPFAAYRRLRELNPSPYQFYLRSDEEVLFGASPETCVKVVPDAADGARLLLRPIAGTRPRGRGTDGTLVPDLDNRLSAELVLDRKEQAEHVMLVDLARNDVARVCVPGSRRVTRLLELEHYSHVSHLVSEVEGRLRPGLDAFHAYQACMNMGTLTGAPKLRASELIAELETSPRGPYGGAVACLQGDGGPQTVFDSAIVIRSAQVNDGMATVRAGAGVVRDSDPQAEADETRRKAEAVLQALRPPSVEVGQ